ncbi:MAG TPA: zinc ribbon domain-containing protein [Candidatus Deferrimicrobium sp.]|nr:zinc ribbon domain-containing protein [Candidatus Deferrimicrobium sp.]
MPIGPGNSKITSYFSLPEGGTHYSQIPEGYNVSAFVIVDNSGGNSVDLINYSFKVAVIADTLLSSDIPIAVKLWDENFTVLAGAQTQITIFFNSSIQEDYPGETLKEIYIKVWWGEDLPYTDSYRLAGVKIGTTWKEVTFFTLKNIVVLIGCIGMALMLFLIVATARRDIQHSRKRTQDRRAARTASQHPPPSQPTPSAARPSSAIPSHAPETSPEQIRAAPLPSEAMTLIPCPQCSSKIDRTQAVCPHCGFELPKCVICNLLIDEDDEIQTCPECGAVGHRAHFREWVHVKGKCPICKNPISFD